MRNSKTLIHHFVGRQKVLFAAFIMLFGIYACSNENAEETPAPQGVNNPSPCASNLEITVNETVGSNCGQSEGSITVSGSGGTGTLVYSIDGQSFQSDGKFSNLKSGTYTITVKDASGCTNVVEAKVELVQDVSLASDIVPLMQSNCAVSGCHVSGAQNPNFSDKANILQNASQILSRTSNRSMPPSSSGKSLTDAQIELIRCWVDAGAKDN